MAYAFSRLELTFCINKSRMQISLAYTVYPSLHKEMGDNIITFGGDIDIVVSNLVYEINVHIVKRNY